jgi:hypothetical protein
MDLLEADASNRVWFSKKPRWLLTATGGALLLVNPGIILYPELKSRKYIG